MTTNEQLVETREKPGFLGRLGRALGRFLWGLVKLMAAVALVGALAVGIWLGVRELSRTFLNLSAESYETARRVDLLRSDVNSLMESETAGRQQRNGLRNDMTAMGGRVTAVEGALSADLARQEEQLASLSGRLDEMMAAGAIISDQVTLLNSGVSALQMDIVGYGSDLDGLGGEVDALESEVSGLAGQTESLEQSLAEPLAGTEDVAELRRVLVLFRVWELVARARLRLVEENPGLALADVQAAQGILAAVMEEAPEEMVAGLQPIQQRLELAAGSLPADPVTAGRDLESAWEALDRLLSEMLGAPFTEGETEEELGQSSS